MEKIITDILKESIKAKENFVDRHLGLIIKGTEVLSECIASGHKILIFGNGGSAADSQHIAAEFVNRFMVERSPLPAIALTTDTSIITAIGNDYGFDQIFSKQVEALGKKGDVAIGISTSGNSKNVIKAVKEASKAGLITMALTGRGGELAECADIIYRVEIDSTGRIQEVHITLGHILCELVERSLFFEKFI